MTPFHQNKPHKFSFQMWIYLILHYLLTKKLQKIIFLQVRKFKLSVLYYFFKNTNISTISIFRFHHCSWWAFLLFMPFYNLFYLRFPSLTSRHATESRSSVSKVAWATTHLIQVLKLEIKKLSAWNLLWKENIAKIKRKIICGRSELGEGVRL